jgi:tRNA nucleotidyltransferase (CCA-adding enzyme)
MAKTGHVYPQVEPGAAALMDRRIVRGAPGLRVGAAQAAAAHAGAHALALGPRVAVRQAELMRAVRWGLPGLRALEMAWHELPEVTPDTPEIAVRRLVLAGAGLILVRHGGRLVGFVDGRAATWARPALSVAHRLEHPPDAGRETLVWLLRLAGKLGEAMGVAVWAAGGFVRDLLRDTGALDVDLVVEGDGPAFARRLAEEVRGQATVHPMFGTASVEGGRTVDGQPLPRVDVASARRERYAGPGALPAVESAPLGEDLLRRDFTVNAMAIALGPAVFGRLVDGAGGQRDLDRRTLVPLHPLSFVEDPTRVFRAARYAARLGFHLDASGRRALRLALGVRAYPTLSGQRLLAELGLILREPTAWGALALLLQWRALGLWDRAYRTRPRTRERLRAARRLLAWGRGADLGVEPQEVALLALLVDQPPSVARRCLQRLALGGGRGARLAAAPAAGRRLAARLAAPRLAPSRVAAAAREGTAETVVAAWLLGTGRTRRRLQWYLREGRHVQPAMSAAQLIATGVPRGPAVGQWLRNLRDLALDGRVGSLADEERFVKRLMARHPKGEPT